MLGNMLSFKSHGHVEEAPGCDPPHAQVTLLYNGGLGARRCAGLLGPCRTLRSARIQGIGTREPHSMVSVLEALFARAVGDPVSDPISLCAR
eukprot:3636632-Rhodomonas_salina.1